MQITRWAHCQRQVAFFYFILCIDVIKRSKVKRVKVKDHKRPRSSGSKVKVTINVKEKAGGLMPTSSCFIFIFL